MLSIMCVWKIILNLLLALDIINAQSGTECVTPNDERALCISVFKCQAIQKIIETRNEDGMKFWQKSQCGYEEDPLVCCGTWDKFISSHIPGRQFCGFSETTEDSDIDEFPWTAQLQYRNSNIIGNGVLISSRFILTLASNTRLVDNGTYLEKVTFRKANTKTNSSCVSVRNGTECSGDQEEFGVESIIVSGPYFPPQYNKSSDDGLALIKLSEDVKHRRPICLPLRNETSREGDIINMSTLNASVSVTVDLSPWCRYDPRMICVNYTHNSNENVYSVNSEDIMMATSPSNINQWYIKGFRLEEKRTPYFEGTLYVTITYLNVEHFLDWIYTNTIN